MKSGRRKQDKPYLAKIASIWEETGMDRIMRKYKLLGFWLVHVYRCPNPLNMLIDSPNLVSPDAIIDYCLITKLVSIRQG